MAQKKTDKAHNNRELLDEIDDLIERIQYKDFLIDENGNTGLNISMFKDTISVLSDVMQQLKRNGNGITFKEAVYQPANGGEWDITELIRHFRNAAEHMTSQNNYVGDTKVKYNVVTGKCNAIKVGDAEFSTEYEDDLAIITGSAILYVQRNLIRALTETRDKLENLVNNE